MQKAFIVGGAAVAAADIGSGFLPASLDVNGMPVRAFGAAILGAKLAGAGSLVHSAIAGVVAILGASLLGNFGLSFPVNLGPVTIDPARIAGGGVGVWGAHKLHLE